MDPRRVLTFRVVAHERSFSRAARVLSLSQPSVSNQVALLEREIGARLLNREPGGVRLTGAGEILLEHADAIAERFQLAAGQLAAVAQGERARLRVGAFPTALAALVPAAIARLRVQHPDATVSVEEGSDDELLGRVRSGELHVAVAFQDAAEPRREPPGVERRDLFRERFRVALAPDHPLAERQEVRLAELAGMDWTVAVTDGLIVRACRAAGFEPNLVSITRDQLAIRGLVGRGLAVTLVPELLAEPFKDLCLRPIAGASPSRDVYALLPPGGRHPMLATALEAFETTAEELSGPTVTPLGEPAGRRPAPRAAPAPPR
jgi:DNA-binding transcriptional LysR family regulator